MSLERLFAGRNVDVAAMKMRMERLMAAEGLEFGDRTMTFNSRLAQELAQWAACEKGVDAIHTELFRAYFVKGLNLASIGVLVSVARGLGLDPEQARSVIETRSWSEAVDRDWERSRNQRVGGVPTFRLGTEILAGAQPYERLEEMLVSQIRLGSS